MALSDVPASLVARCRRGEEAAFDELFAAIHEDLARWFFSLLRNEEDAQEAVQECFVRIFRHLHTLEDPAKFSSWVGRLVVNLANTSRTRAGRHRMESLEPGIEVDNDQLPLQGRGPADPREAASRTEILRRVNEAVTHLPPRQRTAVMMFDVQNIPIARIAEELGCSQGAVKFNIFQGRRKLRELLADLGEDLLPRRQTPAGRHGSHPMEPQEGDP